MARVFGERFPCRHSSLEFLFCQGLRQRSFQPRFHLLMQDVLQKQVSPLRVPARLMRASVKFVRSRHPSQQACVVASIDRGPKDDVNHPQGGDSFQGSFHILTQDVLQKQVSPLRVPARLMRASVKFVRSRHPSQQACVVASIDRGPKDDVNHPQGGNNLNPPASDIQQKVDDMHLEA